MPTIRYKLEKYCQKTSELQEAFKMKFIKEQIKMSSKFSYTSLLINLFISNVSKIVSYKPWLISVLCTCICTIFGKKYVKIFNVSIDFFSFKVF